MLTDIASVYDPQGAALPPPRAAKAGRNNLNE
jgi:hypothetical protein